ncbi:MAG: type II CAAX endopeptidase family protein [Vicinamibacteria bacterium]
MNERRPAAWPVLLTFVVLLFAIQVAGALVLAAWAYLSLPAGNAAAVPAQIQVLISTPVGLSVVVLMSAVPLILVAVVGGLASGEPLADRLRTRVRGVRWGLVPLAVLGLAALSHGLNSLIQLSGLADQGTLRLMGDVIASARGWELLLLGAVLALGAGTAEELFFRGFLQQRLSRRFTPRTGVLVAAVCFGLMHADWVQGPAAALLGLYLGWVVERAGSVVPAMVAHAVNNSIAVFAARWELPESTAIHVAVLLASLLLGTVLVLAQERAYRRASSPIR